METRSNLMPGLATQLYVLISNLKGSKAFNLKGAQPKWSVKILGFISIDAQINQLANQKMRLTNLFLISKFKDGMCKRASISMFTMPSLFIK
jgi:hypothetical protein